MAESNTLKSIMHRSKEIEAILEESNGEITTEIEQKLESVSKSLAEKVDSYYFVIEDLTARAEALKLIENDYYLARKQIESHIEYIKAHLKHVMSSDGLDKLEGEQFKFTLSKSKPRVVINNVEIIERDYMREKITLEPDKERIFDDLSMGMQVAGCHLEQGFTLRKGIKK